MVFLSRLIHRQNRSDDHFGEHFERFLGYRAGKKKIYKTAHHAFKGLAFVAQNEPHLLIVNETFERVKAIPNSEEMLARIPSICSVFHKTKNDIQCLHEEFRYCRTISRHKCLKVFTHMTDGCAKLISFVGKGTYHHIAYASDYVDLGETAAAMGNRWKYISLIGSGAKILSLFGKIFQGKNVVQNSFNLLIDHAPGCVFNSLEIARVKIHPAIPLAIGFVQCGYGLYKAWKATA